MRTRHAVPPAHNLGVICLFAALGLFLAVSASAGVIHYVDLNSPGPASPYTSWASAAANIQDAIDAAAPGDTVLVTNGVYATGGRVVFGAMTNRLVINKAVTVQSFNGPSVTVIQGYQVPGTTNGDSAVRCVYMANGTSLVGFTLTKGATRSAGDALREESAGALFCEGYSCVVSNCVLANNSSFLLAGGAYFATLNNCVLKQNSTAGTGGGAYFCILNNCCLTANSSIFQGGGAVNCTLQNCTITANAAGQAPGGVYGCTLGNCIIFYNTSSNYDGPSTMNYCCTTPLPPGGTGNIASDPQFADSSHITAGSPCRSAGNPLYATNSDIDGEAWANPPSIGCDEYYAASATGPLNVTVEADNTNVMSGFPANFTGQIIGHASSNRWDFGDSVFLDNQPYAASHSWALPGDYSVRLIAFNNSNPGGISATVVVHVLPPVLYVALTSTNLVPPYYTWATAATNIQDAIDDAAPGATVFVSNGVYATGGRVVYGALTNRLAINKAVTVQSVNGPSVTVIQGHQVPGTTNGDSAVRCVYMTNGASLTGFTLTNGATRSSGDSTREQEGGALWCESTNAMVSNCVLVGNSAIANAGGASRGTLNNCMLKQNSTASFGGGAVFCNLYNCLLTANSAVLQGGGAEDCNLFNCTITANTAGQPAGSGALNCQLYNCIILYNPGSNYFGSTMYYCCTMPLPHPQDGTNNIASDPQFADASHLTAGSPCRGAGSPLYVIGSDIDGEAWANPPSIGCDEYYAASATGPLQVAVAVDNTNVGPGFPANFAFQITGHASSNRWDFGDGVFLDNQPYAASHSWALPGDYSVRLIAYNNSNPGGISNTIVIHVAPQSLHYLHYVALTSTNPVAPYVTWATAANKIQNAIDAALDGDTVLVNNGVYQTGGRVLNGAITNRVAITNAVTLQSVNGPSVTIIQGYQVPGATNGSNAVRCVYLGSNAVLSGFTLTNGATGTLTNGAASLVNSGGGVWCAANSALVSNCVLAGNAADVGGGAYGGSLAYCTLVGNRAAANLNGGGGAAYAVLSNCVITSNTAPNGGGAFNSTLIGCTLTGNSAGGSQGFFGGAYGGTLSSCILTGNSAGYCGGAGYATLINCTVVGNRATNSGGGTYRSSVLNSIVYYNTALTEPNYFNDQYGGSLGSCCTTPLPTNGTGNITNAPLFVNQVGGDFHLQPSSPCINAGNNSYVTNTTDLDGNPRVVDGTVDIGAYEFQVPNIAGYLSWLQQYGLPTDGSADFADPDHDGLNNWQEWRAGTDPTNAASVLLMLNPIGSSTNIIVTWQSVTNELHYLQRATNLNAQPAFLPLATNLVGQAGTTSYTDTNVAGPGPFFYRVGVQ